MKIPTKDTGGQPNGWVLPIWNSRESDYRPGQAYLTAVAPHSGKGPHLHNRRAQFYQCIVGAVKIISRIDGKYIANWATPDTMPVIVPAGAPSQIINISDTEAILLNLPTIGWAPHDQDEWPVEDWNP